MNRLQKQIDEANEIVKASKISTKIKKELHQAQVGEFEKALYRLWVDVQVAQRMIAQGEKIGEEAYVTQGEKNIQEAVAAMRGAVIQLEKQRDLLKKLG